MKKKLNKKLKLNKEFITSLSKEESKKVMAGFTTSIWYCTGAFCCTGGTFNRGCNTNSCG